TASLIRSLRVCTARTANSRPSTVMAPRGSTRKVRYQLRGFRLHDRMNSRPSTTTIQTPMNRCGSLPARIPTILPLCSSATTSAAKRPRAAGVLRAMASSASLAVSAGALVASFQLRRVGVVRGSRPEHPADCDPQYQHGRYEDEMGGAHVL